MRSCAKSIALFALFIRADSGCRGREHCRDHAYGTALNGIGREHDCLLVVRDRAAGRSMFTLDVAGGRSCNRTNHSDQGHASVDARSLPLRRSAVCGKMNFCKWQNVVFGAKSWLCHQFVCEYVCQSVISVPGQRLDANVIDPIVDVHIGERRIYQSRFFFRVSKDKPAAAKPLNKPTNSARPQSNWWASLKKPVTSRVPSAVPRPKPTK